MNRPDTSDGSMRHRIYAYILSYREREHYAPSVRDICQAMGLKSTSTVQGHIDRMVRDGLLSKRDGRPRTLWAEPAISLYTGGNSNGQGDSAL
jgi:SOS-response transcriptional repressor LexA